jgi:cell division septal protein FtsQ
VHRRGAERGKRVFTVFVIFSWFGVAALAGFFVPSFLTQLPLFGIKKVEVEGNRRVEFSLIRETIEELSADLLNIDEEKILSLLSVRSGGRVKKVFLSRDFSLDGITVRVTVVEREPVARVALGRGYVLIDAEGVIFKPLEGDPTDLPLIKTYDVDLLKEHLPRFYTLVLSIGLPVEQVVVRKDMVVLKLKGKVLILPPLDSLPDSVSDRIKMIYNLREEKVDLRYDRFILVRN